MHEKQTYIPHDAVGADGGALLFLEHRRHHRERDGRDAHDAAQIRANKRVRLAT